MELVGLKTVSSILKLFVGKIEGGESKNVKY
jgi:hypothetical protein